MHSRRVICVLRYHCKYCLRSRGHVLIIAKVNLMRDKSRTNNHLNIDRSQVQVQLVEVQSPGSGCWMGAGRTLTAVPQPGVRIRGLLAVVPRNVEKSFVLVDGSIDDSRSRKMTVEFTSKASHK